MRNKFALAKYSPYIKSSYINNEGAFRWCPPKRVNSCHLLLVYDATE